MRPTLSKVLLVALVLGGEYYPFAELTRLIVTYPAWEWTDKPPMAELAFMYFTGLLALSAIIWFFEVKLKVKLK